MADVPTHAVAASPLGAPVPDGVWAPGRRALTIGLVLTITLVGFEGLAIATIGPVVERDLGNLDLYGWVFSAFFLSSLIGIVVAGRSADRVGPARPFVAGLVFFALGLLGGGIAPTMLLLVVARAVQGFGAGAIPAVAYVAIGRAYPTALQPRMFAVLSSAWVLPGLIGPAISGLVADQLGWRWVFLGLLPLVAVTGTLALPALHALGPPGGAEPVDRRSAAIVLALGAALVLAGASAHSPVVAPLLVVAGLIIGVRAFLRLMPSGTVRLAPGLPAAVALRGLLTFGFFGTDAFVSLTLTETHHVSTVVTGFVITAATLFWTGGAWVQERLVLRVGPQTMVRVGTLTIALGIGLMIVVAQYAVPIGLAVVAWATGGFGMGLAYAPLSLVVLGEAPSGGEGMAAAALQLCDTLGVALGTGVTGAIVAAGASLGWQPASALSLAFALCAGFAVFAAIGAMQLPKTVQLD